MDDIQWIIIHMILIAILSASFWKTAEERAPIALQAEAVHSFHAMKLAYAYFHWTMIRVIPEPLWIAETLSI
jgi:hypothetical protein